MTTVRDSSYEVLRSYGLTTFFGNPGSNELPFLQDFPADFRYILALQEGAALAMADGYAQATGSPVMVNLHSAVGVGQAMGNLVNSYWAGTPLVILSGQQSRPLVTMQGMLTNSDATTLPQPLVKWSFEAPSPKSVPAVLARAAACAVTAPSGPVYVSVPLSDWDEEADSDHQPGLLDRKIAGRPVAPPAALERLAGRLDSARDPVLILGPDVDVYGGWDAAVALAEKAALPVKFGSFEYPRIPFPTDHRCYQGTLGATIDQVRGQLAPYDLVVWIGGPLLPYHAWTPGPFLSPAVDVVLVTANPDHAARAPIGEAIVGDPADALARLTGLVTAGERRMPTPLRPAVAGGGGGGFTETQLKQVLAQVRPDDAAWISETPSLGAWWDVVPINRPNSYFCGAAGGLGYGLPAAVGVALARPDRPVVALIGDGSANYSISGLWTAAQHELDISYVIVRNGAYQVLKDFGGWLKTPRLPGMNLPGIDFVSIAKGYGIPAVEVGDADSLADTLKHSFSSPGPSLIQADVEPEPSAVFR